MNTLTRKVADKSKHYEYKSIAWNACSDNMRKLTNVLLREPCDEKALPDLNDEVYQMFRGLERRCLTERDIIDIAHHRIGGTTATMRRYMFNTQIALLKKDNAQLQRLKSAHASPSDIKILAEATQIKRRYEANGQKLHFLLASTDTNNFSPANSPHGPSRPVTDEILRRFGIECDWPQEILKKYK